MEKKVRKANRDIIFFKNAFVSMSILVVLFYAVSFFVPKMTLLFIFMPYIVLVAIALGLYGAALVIELIESKGRK